jgi:hypothetical protein
VVLSSFKYIIFWVYSHSDKGVTGNAFPLILRSCLFEMDWLIYPHDASAPAIARPLLTALSFIMVDVGAVPETATSAQIACWTRTNGVA